MPSDKLIFRTMKQSEKPIVADMMKSLYLALEAPVNYMTDEKIAKTLYQLDQQPSHLGLEIFEFDAVVAGYALCFKFWYNEFGGMVTNIDELFVKPEFRQKGIAQAYLSALSTRQDSIALSLEVLPENTRAYSLYKRSGFKEKETVFLCKLL